jgi:hypothetical protein
MIPLVMDDTRICLKFVMKWNVAIFKNNNAGITDKHIIHHSNLTMAR